MNRHVAFLLAMLLPAAAALADEPKTAPVPSGQPLAFTLTAEQAQTVYQIVSEHAQQALKTFQADQSVLNALASQNQAKEAAQKNSTPPKKTE